MRHPRSLLGLLFAASTVVAGCANEASEEAAPAAEPAAAPAAEMAAAVPECRLQNATSEEAAVRPSPLQQIEISVGGSGGRLCWGAPSANERTIMGGLVPYGAPWRMGANEPTTIHLTGPARIGEVDVAAGSYSLYAVPGETEWQIFVNPNHERWGIPISPDVRASELGSFTVAPAALEAPVETLMYRWEPNAEGTMGDIVMEWENTQVRFHVHPGM